jgi:hypothetical protein
MRVDAFAPAEAPACHIRPYERDPRRRGSDPATRERRRGGGQRFLWDESDIVIGLLSQRGFLRAVTHHGFAAFRMSVSAVMTPAVVSCELMRQPRIWHVPVIDRGALIGIVSIRDLLADRSSSQRTIFRCRLTRPLRLWVRWTSDRARRIPPETKQIVMIGALQQPARGRSIWGRSGGQCRCTSTQQEE